jgi:hypothetical protein
MAPEGSSWYLAVLRVLYKFWRSEGVHTDLAEAVRLRIWLISKNRLSWLLVMKIAASGETS